MFSPREPQAGGGTVDVIVRPAVSFETLVAKAVAGDLFGRHVPIVSIDDLLLMKCAANRPKDRLDVVAEPHARPAGRRAGTRTARRRASADSWPRPSLSLQRVHHASATKITTAMAR